MALYLYAIINRPDGDAEFLPQIGSGLQEQPLQLVTKSTLAAVVSDWGQKGSRKPSTTNEAELWRHEQVVEAVMAQTTILPVRFGTILTDETRVQQLLVEHQASFHADLARLTGRVEMGLRVLWNPPSPQSPELSQISQSDQEMVATPGRNYLREQAQRLQAEQAVRTEGQTLVDELAAQLVPFVVDTRMQVLQTERLLLSAAYLVERNAIESLARQIDILRQRYPTLSFLLSGPWPAYHFVSKFS